MKQVFVLICSLLFWGLPGHGAENMTLVDPESAPVADVNGWGFDIGFGQQAYMDSANRLAVFTPFLFSRWRLLLDVNSRRLQGATYSPFYNADLSLESTSPLFKGVVSSFVRFGVGVFGAGRVIYPETIITFPVSMGLQMMVANRGARSLSYFMEYRFMAYTDYDSDRSLPNQPLVIMEEQVLFSPTFNFGIRVTY